MRAVTIQSNTGTDGWAMSVVSGVEMEFSLQRMERKAMGIHLVLDGHQQKGKRKPLERKTRAPHLEIGFALACVHEIQLMNRITFQRFVESFLLKRSSTS